MNYVAIRMLMGDTVKYISIIIGITVAAFLMTQQMSIFVGLMSRTFGFIEDAGGANNRSVLTQRDPNRPDIWAMDPKVQFIDDTKPLQDTALGRVRGVSGVEWAVPLYKGNIRARLDDGSFQNCSVIGLDDATLIGGPPVMIEGSLADLRKADAVIVNEEGARGRLARRPRDAQGNPIPGAAPVPLKVGDVLELNDRRAVVVGICRTTRTFQTQPVIYTTYTRATQYAPRERRMLSFVLVKARDGVALDELAAQIRRQTGLEAMTNWDFSWKTVLFFIRNTGIPINFGIAVVLAFLVGTGISGLLFYQFTLENLRQLGALKAMGATDLQLLRMIVLQALIVGLIGYGIGVGLASRFDEISKRSALAFRLLPETLMIVGGAVALIVVLASAISIIKVIRLEPAIVFKS